MTNYHRQLKIGNYPGDPLARRLIASGVWLRLAIVGASAVIGAVIAALGGQAELAPALAIVAGGAILAFVAWKRARALLDEAPASAPAGAAAIRDAKVPRLEAPALH